MAYKKLVLLFMPIFLFTVFSFAGHDAPKLTVAEITGTVRIFNSQKNVWQDACKHYSLNENDIIKTSENSSCEIDCDSSRVKIKENSEIMVKSLIERINLNISYGEILIRLKKLPKASSFVVETPQAVAGARGTKYRVSVEKEKHATRVGVYEKAVEMKSLKEPNKYVVVNEYEEREICPWEKAMLKAEGKGAFSEKESKQNARNISEKAYIKKFGTEALVSSKRSAKMDAYRNLAKKIYGVIIDYETTLNDYADKDVTVRTTVQGIVYGAKEIGAEYYSDGSVKIIMESSANAVKNSLAPITGNIYGIDCIPGPESIKSESIDDFLI